DVSFETAPGEVGSNEFVDGIPALLVFMAGAGLVGRISDHLAPEKTVEIVSNAAGNHSIDDVQVLKTVVIEIPSVAGPRPAADGGPGFGACICESSSQVLKKAVAHGVFSIKCADGFIIVVVKIVLGGDANSRCGPHIGNVKVFTAIIVKIQPGNAHAGAYVLDAGLLGDIGEST